MGQSKRFRSNRGWDRLRFHDRVTETELQQALLNYVTLSTTQTITGDKTFSGDTLFSGDVDFTGSVSSTEPVSVGDPVGLTDAINLQYYNNTLLPAVETLIDANAYGKFIYLSILSRINIVDISDADVYSFISQNTTFNQLASTTPQPNLSEIDMDITSILNLNLTNMTGLKYLLLHTSGTKSIAFNKFVLPAAPDLILFSLEGLTITGLYNMDFSAYEDLFNIGLLGNSISRNAFDRVTVPSGFSMAFFVMNYYDVPNIDGFQAATSQPDLDTLSIKNNQALLTLDLSGTVNSTAEITVEDCSLLTTITLAGGYDDLLSYSFQGNALTIVNVDAILAAVNAAGLSNGTLDLTGGTNGIPTGGIANANVVALTGRGWTVTHNV